MKRQKKIWKAPNPGLLYWAGVLLLVLDRAIFIELNGLSEWPARVWNGVRECVTGLLFLRTASESWSRKKSLSSAERWDIES